MNIWSAYLAYRLIELLSKPFKDWDAYKYNLIDEKGKTIKQPVLSDEKKAFGMFEKIVRNIKQIMNKAIGESRTAALLSTIYLIKEHDDDVAKVILNYCIEQDQNLKESIKLSTRMKKTLQESLSDENYIAHGLYVRNGKSLLITEDLKPIDNYMGYYIYKYKDNVFTKEELEK